MEYNNKIDNKDVNKQETEQIILNVRQNPDYLIERVYKKLELIKQKDPTLNSFIYLNPNIFEEANHVVKKIRENKAGRLAGLLFGVKSNINVKGLLTSAASKTLINYYAPYDADVIKKIKQEDGLIIGMTNMDEFASGSSGETSYFGPSRNPLDLDYIPGGSSSGSAVSVSADLVDISLGSDTGGSIRNPASHTFVYGFKPRYGSVSRYGLLDLSMSLDQIGPFSKSLSGIKLTMDVIQGKSIKDAMTFEIDEENKKDNYFDNKKPKIALIKDFESMSNDKLYNVFLDKIKDLDLSYDEISISTIKLAVQTYYPLVYVEFYSSTRRYDGRRYGYKIEENCGEEVLRRILGGKNIIRREFKDKSYRKALLAKYLIKQDIMKILKDYDVIISPVTPRLPHKINEKISIEDMYAYDAFTIPANLSGIAALSIPIAKLNGLGIGLQVMGSNNKVVLDFAELIDY